MVTARRAPAHLPSPTATAEVLMAWAEELAADVTSGDKALADGVDHLTERLDRVLTHPVLGLLMFLAVMAGLFWMLFALATVPMDLIEATFAGLGRMIETWLPSGPVRDLLSEGLVARIRGMRRDDGTAVFTPSAAAAALVFFVLAMQCLPTLPVTRKETGSLRYAALQLGYMSGLAYVVALLVYQGLRAAGVS